MSTALQVLRPVSQLRERIRLAFARGGVTATWWWVVRLCTGVELTRFFESRAVDPEKSEAAYRGTQMRLKVIDSGSAMERAGHELIEHLSRNSGWRVESLVAAGDSICVLILGQKPAVQCNIATGERAIIDHPLSASIEFGNDVAFLSFLYTRPEFRKRGLAGELLRSVSDYMAIRRKVRIIAHVSGTNIPSIRTFRQCGWRESGFMLTNRRGRVLWCKAPKGLTVRPN